MAKDMANSEKAKKPFNKKKLKYGALATCITVVFIAVVVVINLIAGILTDRKGLKLDLTEGQYYEISQETIDYLKTIKSDVEIAVTLKESSLSSPNGKMVLETLNKFKQYSDRVDVEFYDIASNPDVITKYSDKYNGEITAGEIIVEANDRVKVLNINYEMFDTQTDYYGNVTGYTGYKGEQELLSAVMSVTDANPKNVAFISLYNGSAIYHSYVRYSIASLYTLMNKNGYNITEVDIMTGDLSPELYDMVVLPAPVNDLTPDCIKKLDDFLYNGGKLNKDMIYIADEMQFATPNINDFLEVWGIKIGDSVIYESAADKSQYVMTVLGQQNAAVAQIADTTYSEGLSNTKLPIVAPRVRPVNLLFDANVDRNTAALLVTSDTAYAEPINVPTAEEVQALADSLANGEEDIQEETEATEETTEFDPQTAEKAQQTIIAIASKSSMDESNTEHKNNVMVIGGTAILDSNIVDSPTYNNAEYVINAVNKMCGKENGIIIAQKDFSSHTIDIKASQMKAISRVVIYIIPLIVVAAGIVVYIRRRNR